ncbi:MAG: outer membrane lipoprotein-sorting protein [Verrucomicrobia bacterium]|nr:outer membrane lipoprotein-sorting protein [Verrucomicrobiota bacterium]
MIIKIFSIFRVVLSFLALGIVVSGVSHQPATAADEPEPTGDEVLLLVRKSQAQQYLQGLTGKLRSSETGQSRPMELTMRENVVRFLFREPNEIINLDLNNSGTKLSRVVAGGKNDVPMALYGERVRNTDINYEDLSMRFLYWPDAKIIGEDSLSLQKCWHVRVTNPDGRGPYGTVDVWVAKNSGAMMQMEAYDAQGRKVKQFLVRKGQKYQGAYILKQMRVETFDPATRKVTGITYLEIDDPK